MKFGKSLLTLLHAPWADHYLAYKDLKKTLKRQVAGDAQTNSQVEGAFVTELLQSIAACNGFFTRTEQEIAARLAALVAQLEKPASWVTRTVAVAADATGEVSLGSIAATLEVGTHLDQAHFEALGAFVALCADIDALRKYSMLNYLAVTKIVKKHDKQSALRLREGIINFVASQPFYTSTQLARTFTHAQCLASEIIAAATSASILSQVLPPAAPAPPPPRPARRPLPLTTRASSSARRAPTTSAASASRCSTCRWCSRAPTASATRAWPSRACTTTTARCARRRPTSTPPTTTCAAAAAAQFRARRAMRRSATAVVPPRPVPPRRHSPPPQIDPVLTKFVDAHRAELDADADGGVPTPTKAPAPRRRRRLAPVAGPRPPALAPPRPRASFPASRQPSAGAPDVGASSAHARPASCPVVGASPVPAAAARPSSCPAPEPPPRPPVVLAPDSGPADTSDASPSPKKPRTVLAVASPPAAQPAAVPAAVPPEAAAAAAAAAARTGRSPPPRAPPAALLQQRSPPSRRPSPPSPRRPRRWRRRPCPPSPPSRCPR